MYYKVYAIVQYSDREPVLKKFCFFIFSSACLSFFFHSYSSDMEVKEKSAFKKNIESYIANYKKIVSIASWYGILGVGHWYFFRTFTMKNDARLYTYPLRTLSVEQSIKDCIPLAIERAMPIREKIPYPTKTVLEEIKDYFLLQKRYEQKGTASENLPIYCYNDPLKSCSLMYQLHRNLKNSSVLFSKGEHETKGIFRTNEGRSIFYKVSFKDGKFINVDMYDKRENNLIPFNMSSLIVKGVNSVLVDSPNKKEERRKSASDIEHSTSHVRQFISKMA